MPRGVFVPAHLAPRVDDDSFAEDSESGISDFEADSQPRVLPSSRPSSVHALSTSGGISSAAPIRNNPDATSQLAVRLSSTPMYYGSTLILCSLSAPSDV